MTSLNKGGIGSASVFGSPATRNPSKHWPWHPDLDFLEIHVVQFVDEAIELRIDFVVFPLVKTRFPRRLALRRRRRPYWRRRC